jgi:hypothetical protein
MNGQTPLNSPGSLWRELRDHLERTGELLNQEIRSYPTPIARCDEQLTDLLERRSTVINELRRMDALGGPSLSRGDQIALIEAFIMSPGYAKDEAEARLKAHLAAGLRELSE